MKNIVALSVLLTGTVMAAPVFAQNAQTVSLKNAQGAEVGTVTLTDAGDDVVLVRLDGKNLPEGWHGFHIHEKGDCTAPDFTSAGGHFNPDGDEHGAMHGRDFHAGDLPNIYVHSDGTVKADIFKEDISITDKDESEYLLDADGSAFMIHADADDYKTPKTGNAGERIACGVLK